MMCLVGHFSTGHRLFLIGKIIYGGNNLENEVSPKGRFFVCRIAKRSFIVLNL